MSHWLRLISIFAVSLKKMRSTRAAQAIIERGGVTALQMLVLYRCSYSDGCTFLGDDARCVGCAAPSTYFVGRDPVPIISPPGSLAALAATKVRVRQVPLVDRAVHDGCSATHRTRSAAHAWRMFRG